MLIESIKINHTYIHIQKSNILFFSELRRVAFPLILPQRPSLTLTHWGHAVKKFANAKTDCDRLGQKTKKNNLWDIVFTVSSQGLTFGLFVSFARTALRLVGLSSSAAACFFFCRPFAFQLLPFPPGCPVWHREPPSNGAICHRVTRQTQSVINNSVCSIETLLEVGKILSLLLMLHWNCRHIKTEFWSSCDVLEFSRYDLQQYQCSSCARLFVVLKKRKTEEIERKKEKKKVLCMHIKRHMKIANGVKGNIFSLGDTFFRLSNGTSLFTVSHTMH